MKYNWDAAFIFDGELLKSDNSLTSYSICNGVVVQNLLYFFLTFLCSSLVVVSLFLLLYLFPAAGSLSGCVCFEEVWWEIQSGVQSVPGTPNIP